MADKYEIRYRYNTKNDEIYEYFIVDSTVFPDDPSKFKTDHHEWYRKELLEGMRLVRFTVSPYQSEAEAKRRAQEYLEFMNKQHDQMQVAAKLVQL